MNFNFYQFSSLSSFFFTLMKVQVRQTYDKQVRGVAQRKVPKMQNFIKNILIVKAANSTNSNRLFRKNIKSPFQITQKLKKCISREFTKIRNHVKYKLEKLINLKQINILMEFDYFDNPGQTVIQNQGQESSDQYQYYEHEAPEQNPDDQFDFQEPAQNYEHNTYSNFQQDELARKIRQEQERIQQKLREKANQQYEEKQKRKELGRQQLQEFLERKEREKEGRKQQNREREQRTRQQIRSLNQVAGWKKVAANVALKQGENKGVKDITRMRESIINKRSDQV